MDFPGIRLQSQELLGNPKESLKSEEFLGSPRDSLGLAGIPWASQGIPGAAKDSLESQSKVILGPGFPAKLWEFQGLLETSRNTWDSHGVTGSPGTSGDATEKARKGPCKA